MAEAGQREHIKARMLAVAERLLESEGLASVQARRIATEADCSVGTLYNVFKGGLDDLIIQANDRTLQRLGARLAEVRSATASAGIEATLMALALAYLRFAIEQPKPWRALFDHRMADDREVPEWYRQSQASLFAIVEGALADVLPDPALRRRASRALFSAVHGIVSLALDRKLGDFDPIETEQQVRLVVGATARGLVGGMDQPGGGT